MRWELGWTDSENKSRRQRFERVGARYIVQMVTVLDARDIFLTRGGDIVSHIEFINHQSVRHYSLKGWEQVTLSVIQLLAEEVHGDASYD